MGAANRRVFVMCASAAAEDGESRRADESKEPWSHGNTVDKENGA